MLLTPETVYILTTAKKGMFNWQRVFDDGLADTQTAKYLDQIKGGRVPVEVLVRGKDNAENEKLFVKLTDAIKAAGVSQNPLCRTIQARI
jgi:hypothetical protein